MEIEEGVTKPYEELLFKVKKLDRFEPRSVRTSFLYCISNLSYLHDISYVQKKTAEKLIYQFFRSHLAIQTFWGYYISGGVK